MASVPAPGLIGVQRVVVACEFDSSLSEVERRTLCRQLVKKAQTVTRLPVAAATAADSNPLNLAQLSKQLMLRVKVSGTPVGQRRKALKLTVTPVRLARPQGQMGSLTSTASLVKVADDWLVQGPVDAFATLLRGAPRGLSRPVRSDT